MIGGGQVMDRDDSPAIEGATDPEVTLSYGCSKVFDTDNPAMVGVIAAMERVLW